MPADLLAGAEWEVSATGPGLCDDPGALDGADLHWHAARVPGTGAGARRELGLDALDPDAHDWWFRTRVTAGGPGSWRLELDGLATLADVWVAGEHLLHSENMFRRHHITLDDVAAGTEVVLRCAALLPVLARRRPRPRWRSTLVAHQSLRWHRTSLLGRIPAWTGSAAPVGPWRAVRLVRPPVAVLRDLVVGTGGGRGTVEVEVALPQSDAGDVVRLLVAGETVTATVQEGPDPWVRATVEIPSVELWWPHSHGSATLYPVTIEVGDRTVPLRSVGFRTVDVDRSGGGFQVHVNGVPVFLRGACWTPLEPVTLTPDAAQVRAAVLQARDGGLNVLRVPGTGVYEDAGFWDACDELGVLVWQDAMIANIDLPEDEAFVEDLTRELDEVLADLQGRPSVAVVSGGNEVEQQATFMGLSDDARVFPVLEGPVRDLVRTRLPGVAYVTSSPTGGELPTDVGSGVAHWFGVGAYLRPPADVRLAGVRFAAECLAFANPPERAVVDRVFGSAAAAGHTPAWKAGVPRDRGASWDFEDVRDHYVGLLFDVDPPSLRRSDPELALDLGRAAVAELTRHVFTDWRRPGSRCGGGIVLSLRDMAPGAGWGIVDDTGTPKSPWFALRQLSHPVAVLVTDEGLDGLHLHAVNDTARDLEARLELTAYARGEAVVEQAALDVVVPARGGTTVPASRLLGAFRDLTHVFRFGPAEVDVVHVALHRGDTVLAETVHLTVGQALPREPDVGLTATALREADRWVLDVSSRRCAQWVSLDLKHCRPADNWFHVAPGRRVRVALHDTGDTAPSGTVRAVNSRLAVGVGVGEDA